MATLEQSVYPERWLVLSRDVFQRIADEPADQESLFWLRRDASLVELADLEDSDALGPRLQAVAKDGARAIHLVVEQLDEETMQRLQPLARDDIDIQLHDWFESPGDVLMSLTAPDQAVIDALRRPVQGSEGPALTLLTPANLSNDLAPRYVEALARWEKAAREEWGEQFGLRYPLYAAPPIDWSRIVAPAPALEPDPVDAAVQAAAALARGAIVFIGNWSMGLAARAQREALVRVLMLQAMPDIDAAMPGYFNAAAAGQDRVAWTFVQDGMTVGIEFEFPVEPGRAARGTVVWPGGEELPDHLTLRFADHDYELRLWPAPGGWVREDDGSQVVLCTVEDPVGALRAWLKFLASNAGHPALRVERGQPSAGEAEGG